MAEFKLGRIRFVWQGEWTTAQDYTVDDVVSVGGKTYICVINHTASANFGTDLNIPGAPKWNLVSDGTQWKGAWTPETDYLLGDQVQYGGTVYVCKEIHTSATNISPTWLGLEQDQDKWDAFAQSFYWTGPWATSTKYRVNDFVSNDGYTYICNTAHISAATTELGLENDQSKWSIFNQGFIFHGDWATDTRYHVNDLVKYGASIWICVEKHHSTTFDNVKFQLFVNGLEFENSWDSATTYQVGDVVTYGGYIYIAQQNHSNQVPSTATSYWNLYSTSFNYRSEWDVSSQYRVGDVVRLGGYTFLAIADSLGHTPPNGTYWSQLNSGMRWTGANVTYSAVTGTNVTGTGSGAKFDIVRTGTRYTATVASGFAGTGYAPTNKIKVLGTQLGGLSPANDLTITVDTVSTGAISTISVDGISVTWTSGVTYVLGDIAFWGASSYICVSAHVAASNNRPDNDLTATYWNLLSSGSEPAVLTTEGDMFYYGANGPTRLPIGSDGQVLRVNNGIPEWEYYGLVNNIVYVAPSGEDSPATTGCGLTVDKPWKSVRYACQQVENGYMNMNAAELLVKNKQFIMKEISSFVSYTYTVAVSEATSSNTFIVDSTSNLAANMPISFTGTVGGVVAGTTYYVKTITNASEFSISTTLVGGVAGDAKVLTPAVGSMTGTMVYDSTMCERDVGLIVEALAFDLSHGGNSETVKAANAYFTTAGNAYITGNFGQQAVQTVNSYNYLVDLIADVLANTAPASSYQTLNGTVSAVQNIDSTLVAETGTTALVSNLVGIITEAITAGDVSNVPVATLPNTTIFVKTGTYNEILPIVVPRNTAIVGDELRGTVVQPAGPVALLANDKPKTISALNRIKSVLPNIVSNVPVAPSAGNTVDQVMMTGGKDTAATTSLTASATLISDIITNGLGSVPTITHPDPTGFVVGYSNARRLISANKAFLQAEVSAWIKGQILSAISPFNGFTYTPTNQTKCERDIGYIVDALIYDLTYGGNLATVIAARSYYSKGVFVETGEKAQALAVQAYVKSIIDDIAQGLAITKSSGNLLSQDVSGTGGTLPAAQFAQARIQEMYDTINTGTEPTTIAPSTAWVSSALTTANAAIQAQKSSIQAEAVAWVRSTFPAFVFDATLCSRDVGYIVDAMCYDMMFGSNFLSINAGMSYQRALTSTGVVLTSQLSPTLGIIGFTTSMAKEIANGITGVTGSIVASDRVVNSSNIIYDMVNNGIAENVVTVLTAPPGHNTTFLVGYGDAITQISQNRTFIIDEISAYMLTYHTTVWNGLQAAGQASCTRDVGYIIDALIYDLTYGGNQQTLIAARAYFSFSNLVIGSDEKTAIIDTYGRLKTVVQQIATKTSVTATAGNTTSQVTTGTAGSAGSGTFARDRVQDIIDYITNGTSPAVVEYAALTLATDSLQRSFAALQAAKSEIQSDTVVWVKKFHQEMNFDSVVCSRDASYIVDALSYDLLFGSNFNAITVGRSYFRNLTSTALVMSEQKDAELGAINFIKNKVKAIVGVGTVAQANNLIGDVTTAINGGSVPRFLWPDFTGVDAQNAVAAKVIWTNKEFFKAETLQYITNNYPSASYSKEVCARDVGYLIDAVRYDMTYGGNVATRNAAMAYYSQLTSALEIDAADKAATLAAYGNLKTALQDVANGGLSSYTPLQTMASYITGSSNGDAASATMVGALVQAIIDYITDPVANPITETTPSTSWVSSGLTTQYAALQSAKTTIQTAVTNYVNTNFPLLNYNSATCARDVGYIIDAVGYDFMFGSNFRSVKAGMSYYRAQASAVIGMQKEATIEAFKFLQLRIAATIGTDATALASANKNMETLIAIIENGIGETPEVHGTMTYNNTTGTIQGAEFIRANREFLANEATAWISATFGGTVTEVLDDAFITDAAHNLSVGDPVTFTGTVFGGVDEGATYVVAAVLSDTEFTLAGVTTTNDTGSMTVTYSYDPVACRRDMTEYLNAIVYDLNYVGNYKALRAATLYNNAVGGSEKENMYLVRNGTGVRNQTLSGLNGKLTNPNSFGTRRPTAGAYVSLDPGFGPNDQKVWITTRSCYSQNVTMFGTGCTGGKIDGALHAGGYRSTVANDFTTILSDGIGVWVTGSGALTELVSVFNYYGYAGYLSELGGRIRATNGNSSYGTYGVIAEGVDTFEVPLYGTVDNRYNEAQVTNVVTDGTNQVLRFEYGNAGSEYTNNVPSISGSGYNAAAIGDEFRDGALFETRIIDKNDGNGVGGTNYATQANVAQGGGVGYITIAATDTALTDAYNGMRIQITGGTGVGQYANILTFLNGSKVAQIYKDSFTNLTVTGSTTTVLQVASTATLYVNMPIYLSDDTAGVLTANTVYYVESIPNGTTFKVKSTTGGSAITGLTATSGQTITLYAAGWDHVVPGATTTNLLDLTSAYIIEPRISYTAPGYTRTARTMATSATWQSATYAAGNYVAVASGGTVSNYSTDGVTWASAGALTASTNWTSVAYAGGEGATATAVVGGLGGSGAVLVAVLGKANTSGAPLADQVESVIIVDGGQNYTTPPTIIFTPVSGGSGAIASCTVLNGKIASVTVDIPGSGYNAVPTVEAATDRITKINVNTWGRNYPSTVTVTVSGGGSSNQATATAVLTNGGVSAIHLLDADGLEETVDSGYKGWSGSGYTSTPTVTILDAAARYVAISGNANNSAKQTVAGLGSAWVAGGSTGKTDLKSLTYGNGLLVAVGGTSTTPSCVSSIDGGTTWNTRSITGSVTYSKVAYGAGKFVAISTGDNVTSTSSNAVSWTAGGALPASTTWSGLAYGNGRFVAVASGGTAAAYSVDGGATWTAAILPATAAWSQIKYGQGLFIATATSSSSCATSPDGINWTLQSMPSSSNWQALAFGNPSKKPTWVAISSTTGTAAASINTGAQALGRVKVASGVVTEIRMIEPGSGYPKGTVTATTGSSDLITVDNTVNLIDQQPVEFFGTGAGGLVEGTTYYVIGSTITSTQFKVSATAGGSAVDLSDATISGMTYRAGPIATITDSNKVKPVNTRVRMGDGALGNPSFSNRGSNNSTATADIGGDGYGDLYQPSAYINIANMYNIPVAGANIEFASLPGQYFKLVIVTNELGKAGEKTAQFQINPALTVAQAPVHGDLVTARLYYSQVRLTGHDFLYIGTGNRTQTNYPNVDPTTAIQSNQELASGGGRVFFTSTDQDGNFNVGNLFGVQQATGTATLNASAFNLAGLNSLQLGAVELGVGSAIITQFSTDPYFTANSDNIVPTQRAIKAYITAQIGGGSSSLNVNTLTSGVVYVANNTISTTTGVQINVTSKMNFTGGIDGAPVALGFFMQR